MTVSKITCPECKTVLKPAKPVPEGKPVKCPECGCRFGAGDPVRNDKAEPVAKKKAGTAAADEPAPKKAKKVEDKKKAEKAKPEEKKPDKKPTDDDDDEGGVYGYIKDDEEEEEDDEDDEDEDEDEDDEDDEAEGKKKKKKKPKINYAPDMSVKDLRGPAVATITPPSNLLILAGILGFLGWIALLVIILVPILFPVPENSGGDQDAPPKPVVKVEHGFGAGSGAWTGAPVIPGGPATGGAGEPPAEPPPASTKPSFYSYFGLDLALIGVLPWYISVFLIFLPLFLGMAYCAVVAYGAVKIQNLESRAWGIASSIMIMVPLHCWGFKMALVLLVQVILGILAPIFGFSIVPLIIVALLPPLACVGIGVWNLLTLMRPDVVAGFEYKSEA